MRKILSIIIAFWCFSSVGAQNRNSLVQRMNEIKSMTEVYYWDQATYLNVEEAKRVATERLLISVNNDRNGSELTVEEIMPYTQYINIDRGEKKQCFAYVKKTDALSFTSSNNPVAPINDPSIGVPVNVTTSISSAPLQRTFVPDAFVQRIMEAKTFMNVYKLLKSQQAQGLILQFGKLKDVDDYNSLDLILFDMQSQEIITMLSPITAYGSRMNAVNGTEDSLDNYPTNMTAVIWYIKK